MEPPPGGDFPRAFDVPVGDFTAGLAAGLRASPGAVASALGGASPGLLTLPLNDFNGAFAAPLKDLAGALAPSRGDSAGFSSAAAEDFCGSSDVCAEIAPAGLPGPSPGAPEGFLTKELGRSRSGAAAPFGGACLAEDFPGGAAEVCVLFFLSSLKEKEERRRVSGTAEGFRTIAEPAFRRGCSSTRPGSTTLGSEGGGPFDAPPTDPSESDGNGGGPLRFGDPPFCPREVAFSRGGVTRCWGFKGNAGVDMTLDDSESLLSHGTRRGEADGELPSIFRGGGSGGIFFLVAIVRIFTRSRTTRA